MTMQRIKTGDMIVVIAGKNKGAKGKVLHVFPKKQRVLVEGVNLVKKHTKPNPQQEQQGGIIEREMSIHISNVVVALPPQKGQGEAVKQYSKIGVKTLENNRKVRYYKATDEMLDVS